MKRQDGFTLLELLISMVLSLFVIGGLLSVFFGARTSFQSTSGIGSVAEGGRFATDFIARTTRTAGVMGCAISASTDVSNLNTATTLPLNFAQAMAGFEATSTAPGAALTLSAAPTVAGSSAFSPALDATLTALSSPPVVGSDVLVVRTSLEQAAGMYVTAIADGTTSFTVNNATIGVTGPGSVKAGNLAVISDCVKSTVFQVSSIAGNVISHAIGGSSPGNATGPFLASYGPGAMVWVPDTIVYYIGVGADGDGALYAVDMNGQGVFQAPSEVVSDVENMQVLYGIDTVGNNAVTQYVTASAVPDFNTVVSVKVALLVASQANALPPPAPTVPQTFSLLGTTVTAPLDRKARKVFEATIAVRAKAT